MDEFQVFGEGNGLPYEHESYDEYDEDDEDEDHFLHEYLAEYPEYTSVRQLTEHVTFIRPEFDKEGQDVIWCLTNGFEEVEPGTWSGAWYWRKHGGSMAEAKKARLERLAAMKNQQRQRQKFRCRNVNDEVFQEVLKLKQQGNAAFQRRRYNEAIDFYEEAHRLGGVSLFLEGEQKTQKVNILSNTAECHLRLGHNMEAGMAATEALQLDKRHVKSLLRRAKASLRQATGSGLVMALSQAEDDLQKVIRMGGDGVKEAEQLLAQLENSAKAWTSQLQNGTAREEDMSSLFY